MLQKHPPRCMHALPEPLMQQRHTLLSGSFLANRTVSYASAHCNCTTAEVCLTQHATHSTGEHWPQCCQTSVHRHTFAHSVLDTVAYLSRSDIMVACKLTGQHCSWAVKHCQGWPTDSWFTRCRTLPIVPNPMFRAGLMLTITCAKHACTCMQCA